MSDFHINGFEVRKINAGLLATCEICEDEYVIRGGIQSSEQLKAMVAHRTKHFARKSDR